MCFLSFSNGELGEGPLGGHDFFRVQQKLSTVPKAKMNQKSAGENRWLQSWLYPGCPG